MFKISVIILVAFLTTSVSWAQSVTVNLSNKHLSKLNSANSGHKRMMKYYKFYKKDSLNMAKQMERLAKKNWDSLARVDIMKARIAKQFLKLQTKDIRVYIDSVQAAYKLNTAIVSDSASPDSSKYLAKQLLKGLSKSKVTLEIAKYGHLYEARSNEADIIKQELKKWWAIMKDPSTPDSVQQLAKEKVKECALAQANKNPQFKGMMQQYQLTGQAPDWAMLNKHVPGMDTLQGVFDSTPDMLLAKAEGLAEEALSQTGGLGEIKSKQTELNTMKSQFNQLNNPEAMKADAKEKVKQEAIDHFADHSEKLQSAQQKMSVLLAKYSSFTNASDLSDAVKRTSLQGKTFKERLVIGGNINILSIKPVALDFAPKIGYRFNTRFNMGIGINYRLTLGDSLRYQNYVSPTNSSVRVFANWDAFRDFFLYSEFERSGLKSKNSEINSIVWNNSLFVGIGKKLLIHPKLYMTVTALYNLLGENTNPAYPKRFQVRIGFQTSDLAFRKKNIYYSR